jgi:WD40 repeat protein
MLRRYNPEDYAFTDSQMILFDRDGNQLDVIFPMSHFRDYAFSPDGRSLAFIADDLLCIADMQSHTVNNLCFAMRLSGLYPQMAWSPDSNYLAFTYDGNPILPNTETLEMQIL